MEFLAKLLHKSGAVAAGNSESDGGGDNKPGDQYFKKSSAAEKGDRISLSSVSPSESSFASAIENTSLPDLLQNESVYKYSGLESDTDTSTAYESAGENEGNVSYLEDQFSSFSESFLTGPNAISSPIYQAGLDETVVLDSSAEAPTTTIPEVAGNLDSTIQISGSSSTSSKVDLNISELAGSLATLSLKTPLKLRETVKVQSLRKERVVLDSDCSGDLYDSSVIDLTVDLEKNPVTEEELQSFLDHLSNEPINDVLSEVERKVGQLDQTLTEENLEGKPGEIKEIINCTFEIEPEISGGNDSVILVEDAHSTEVPLNNSEAGDFGAHDCAVEEDIIIVSPGSTESSPLNNTLTPVPNDLLSTSVILTENKADQEESCAILGSELVTENTAPNDELLSTSAILTENKADQEESCAILGSQLVAENTAPNDELLSTSVTLTENKADNEESCAILGSQLVTENTAKASNPVEVSQSVFENLAKELSAQSITEKETSGVESEEGFSHTAPNETVFPTVPSDKVEENYSAALDGKVNTDVCNLNGDISSDESTKSPCTSEVILTVLKTDETAKIDDVTDIKVSPANSNISPDESPVSSETIIKEHSLEQTASIVQDNVSIPSELPNSIEEIHTSGQASEEKTGQEKELTENHEVCNVNESISSNETTEAPCAAEEIQTVPETSNAVEVDEAPEVSPGTLNISLDEAPASVEQEKLTPEQVPEEDIELEVNGIQRTEVSQPSAAIIVDEVTSPVNEPCTSEIVLAEELAVQETDEESVETKDGLAIGVDPVISCSISDQTIPTQLSDNLELNPLSTQVSEEELSKDKTIPQSRGVCNESAGNSFDDLPLPVKSTRTFEEILAAELGVEDTSHVATETIKLSPGRSPTDSCSPSDVAPVHIKSDEEPSIAEVSEEGSEKGEELASVTEVCTVGASNSLDDAPTPVEAPLSSDEILPAELPTLEVAKEISGTKEVSSPKVCSAIPASSFDEAPIPVKRPLTFEELLARELAAENNIEDAVPSFAKSVTPGTNAIVPEKSAKPLESLSTSVSLEQIVASETSTLDEEPEPLISNEDSSKLKSPSSNAGELDTLIEKCKRQEQDLESGDDFVPDHQSDFEVLSAEASRLSIGCLEASREIETDSSTSPSPADKTVIMADNNVDDNFNPFITKSKVPSSPVSTRKSNDEINPFATKSKVASSPPSYRTNGEAVNLSVSTGSPRGNQEQVVEIQSNGTNHTEVCQDQASESFESLDAFKDPSAFDFLSLHGGLTRACDLRKQSLYVKFDPLVSSATTSNTGGILLPTMQPTHPEKSLRGEEYSDTPNENEHTPEKGTAESACQPPPRNTLRTSQQPLKNPALCNVDRLISLSPAPVNTQGQNNSAPSSPARSIKTTSAQTTPSKTPAQIMLNETLESFGSTGTIVSQDDLIKKLQEHQAVLAEQDMEYQKRIRELEIRNQELEDQSQLMNKQLEEKDQSLSKLGLITKEYEKTISCLVAEKSQEEKANQEREADLAKERDQVQQHLNNMEIAFSDLHAKYERSKTVVEALKKNEEALSHSLNEKEADLEKAKNMYEMLKSHAVAKLEKANQDLEALKQKHQQEMAKLKAMVKKLELKTKSQEETLEQKTKENQALTAICDELISKVGD